MFRRVGLIVPAILTSVLLTGLSAHTAQASPVPAPRTGLIAPRATITNIAHRGASHYAPENTLAAFREAKTRHADLFETDVQLTKDGEPVLMHDTTLARTTDAEDVFPGRSPWNVRDFTLAEIRRLDAGSWFGAEYKGEPVPTLGDALTAMERAGLGLLLEVKSPKLYPDIGRRIAAELSKYPSWSQPDPNGRRLIVQSFDWDFIRDFQPLMPHIPRGLLGKPATGELPAMARFADQINPSHNDLTADYATRVHRLGMEVFAWTIDDAAGMRRAIGRGADGVITNRPDILRDIIGSGATRKAAA